MPHQDDPDLETSGHLSNPHNFTGLFFFPSERIVGDNWTNNIYFGLFHYYLSVIRSSFLSLGACL